MPVLHRQRGTHSGILHRYPLLMVYWFDAGEKANGVKAGLSSFVYGSLSSTIIIDSATRIIMLMTVA